MDELTNYELKAIKYAVKRLIFEDELFMNMQLEYIRLFFLFFECLNFVSNGLNYVIAQN